MATTNAALTQKARESLTDNWGIAVGTNAILLLISAVGNDFMLIFGGPLQAGISIFSLKLARGQKAEVQQLFDGFKTFANTLVAYLLMLLFVLLWALLLIVPGIIAAIAYSQTFFLLADNPKLKGGEALKQSKAMMRGYKWKYFCLCWRFFGWFLLSILTLGVGFLFLMPYTHVSFAHFYEDIKNA
jgi:uncharacterized membrane protein